MELSTILSIISIIMTGAGLIWIGGFRLSALIHDVNALKVNGESLETRIDTLELKMERGFEKIELKFEKFENKLEALQTEFHKHDIRINTLEQSKS